MAQSRIDDLLVFWDDGMHIHATLVPDRVLDTAQQVEWRLWRIMRVSRHFAATELLRA